MNRTDPYPDHPMRPSDAARQFLDWADSHELRRYTIDVAADGSVYGTLIRDTQADADRVRLLVPWKSTEAEPVLPALAPCGDLGSARGWTTLGCMVEVISREPVAGVKS
jgi:hypothetical protein